jgi:3-deoxy-D-manno-octulosonic-acid transferase
VIGRSFGSLGGSDPIEPIALGKPAVIGPRFTNFDFVVRTFRDADAIVVTEPEKLAEVLRELLAHPDRRDELARRGAACIRSQQGATQRHAEKILQLLQQAAVAK